MGRFPIAHNEQDSWTPYAFSWRWGLQGDPGHQGYHGLKENITDDFICLGTPKGGLNETLYVRQKAGSRYYLWASVVASHDIRANIIAGGLKPAAVYVNGLQMTGLDEAISLKSGANPLLICYDKPGRGHFVLERTDSTGPNLRTPLSMQWYDRPGRLHFDVRAGEAVPAGWYRFTAPPGLRAMTATVRGKVQAWADGNLFRVEKQEVLTSGAIRYSLQLENPISPTAKVALRIEHQRGCYGGAALPEPISLECGSGSMAVGDWSADTVLESYSGGACYRKTVSLTSEQIRNKVLLNMGDVVATAEVHINSRLAGIRVAPPWKVDVSELVKPGENRVEIIVYNTPANHYLTIPTRYRGSLRAGLFGPVNLEISPAIAP